jgi:hypothetical protein
MKPIRILMTFLALLIGLALVTLSSSAAPPTGGSADFPIPGGRFFTQAGRQGWL